MSNKELAHVLLEKIPDSKLPEVVNFILFVYGKCKNEFNDLLTASESSLNFWDNEDDEIWNKVL